MNIIYKNRKSQETLLEDIPIESNPLSKTYNITNDNDEKIGIVEGYSNEYGELVTVIHVYPDFQKQGIGFDAFKKIYDELNSVVSIKTIIGNWHRGNEFQYCENGISTNMNVFLEEIKRNPNMEEVAFLTPTGKWAKKLGYSECKIKKICYEDMTVHFMKPDNNAVENDNVMIEFEKFKELEKKYYPNCELEPISQYNKDFPLSDEKRKTLKEYEITYSEYLAVLLLCGNMPRLFQECRIEKRCLNELESVFSNLLDSTLEKLPPAEWDCLVRYDCYSDLSDYEENKIVTVDYYLTTTAIIERELSVKGTKVIWVITPLPKNETRARCIYPIHEITGKLEFQVNFMRGTKFKIDKIESVETESYSRMYVTEIKL